jgi:hypothetical protein
LDHGRAGEHDGITVVTGDGRDARRQQWWEGMVVVAGGGPARPGLGPADLPTGGVGVGHTPRVPMQGRMKTDSY